jgi:hypothetical protein
LCVKDGKLYGLHRKLYDLLEREVKAFEKENYPTKDLVIYS